MLKRLNAKNGSYVDCPADIAAAAVDVAAAAADEGEGEGDEAGRCPLTKSGEKYYQMLVDTTRELLVLEFY